MKAFFFFLSPVMFLYNVNYLQMHFSCLKTRQKKSGSVFWRLERINGIYVNFNGKIHFVIQANCGTSLVTEQIKLVCQDIAVFCNISYVNL